MPDQERRANLVEWRKRVIAARENWLANIKLTDRGDRESIALFKGEAADCLKMERACTQLIETIDGKRAAPGELVGDKEGWLTHRTPRELDAAFALCRGIADYGLTT